MTKEFAVTPAGELPLLLERQAGDSILAVEVSPKIRLLEIYSFCQQLPLTLIERLRLILS
ncbi:hypothetical protein NO758_04156 [Planktothrix agardhii]|nr:conserved hypothetical protein [Planktothrix agardhii]CAD5976566.1 hypothetical protein NO758_04156 [Planktothrix agardhii]